jgi:hypothetical protein
MNPATLRDDPSQLVNTLKAFAELRQSGAIDETEYQKLKLEVLAALEQCIKRGPADAPPPTGAAPVLQGIDEYAGGLHRVLADALAQEYPKVTVGPQDEQKRYCMELAARLLSRGALAAGDMAPMTKMIQTIMDEQHAQSLETMVRGRMAINAVRREIRESATSSELARTIAGIVSDSAEKAVDMEASATPGAADALPGGEYKRRSGLWNTVKEDGMGAMVGAATAATIIAGPGFPLASLAVVGALGPAAAVVPALGALIGGGMMSGIALAQTRP